MKELLINLFHIARWKLGKRVLSKSYLSATDNIRKELAILRKHFKTQERIYQLKNKRSLMLNLGCGPHVKKDWVNIDMYGLNDQVFELDLREPIPLPNNSCSVIYSEHFFEHIGYPLHAENLLVDYFRLLQPGGLLSIGVPDGEIALRAYSGDDPERFFTVSKEQWHPDWANTRMEQINYMFRQDGEHRFIYDEETLCKAIQRAGFIEAKRRPFDPQLDSSSRAWGTLYVEARR